MDDGVIIAFHSVLCRVVEDFAFIDILSHGLHLRIDKCSLRWPSTHSPQARATYSLTLNKCFDQADTILFQAPLGMDEFIISHVNGVMENVHNLLRATEDIEDMQTSFTLLRMCTGVAKVSYLLHLITSHLSVSFATRFDEPTTSCHRRPAGGVKLSASIAEFNLPFIYAKLFFGIRLTAVVDVAAFSLLRSVDLVWSILARVLPPSAFFDRNDPEVKAAYSAWLDMVHPKNAYLSKTSSVTQYPLLSV